jgi:VWFA-related protein
MSKGRRYRGWGVLTLLFMALPGSVIISQQRHESVVINIEVPVRVLKGDAFVDGLALADFEVFENGVRQPLEAVYLIKDKEVIREEKAPGASPPRPRKGRNYVLYLELKEYFSQAGDAIDFFINKVLTEDDSLLVVTPVKTYRFHTEVLSSLPRQQIADRLKSILKKDARAGSSRYRSLLREFYKLATEVPPIAEKEVLETMLFDILRQIRDQTEITERDVMRFADALKTLKGEKHVFLMLQRDVIPLFEFEFERGPRLAQLVRPASFDIDKLKRYLSDASITVHCLYISKVPDFAAQPMLQTGSVEAAMLRDLSPDIYASFREMADATGGLSESTTNPDFAIRKAAEASANYYLLYYRPVDYRADGRFQAIEVRVKGEGLKVTHRLGYVAD